MAKMLHALMDSTDHVMEDGAPQKLEVGVSISAYQYAVNEEASLLERSARSVTVSNGEHSKEKSKSYLQAPEPQIIPNHLDDAGSKIIEDEDAEAKDWKAEGN